jgi:hypothetical protein
MCVKVAVRELAFKERCGSVRSRETPLVRKELTLEL